MALATSLTNPAVSERPESLGPRAIMTRTQQGRHGFAEPFDVISGSSLASIITSSWKADTGERASEKGWGRLPHGIERVRRFAAGPSNEHTHAIVREPKLLVRAFDSATDIVAPVPVLFLVKWVQPHKTAPLVEIEY